MKIIHVEQGTQEWLNWRNGAGTADFPCITATAASSIGGRNKYQGAQALMEEFLGVRPPVESNFAMERGSRLEAPSRQSAEIKLKNLFVPFCIQSDEHPWIRASLDGLDMTGDEALEIKCPILGNLKMAEAILDGQPLWEINGGYYDQVQWQYLASDNQIKKIYFCVYNEETNDNVISVIEPNFKRQSAMLALAKEWREHLATQKDLLELAQISFGSHTVKLPWKRGYAKSFL